MKKLITLLIYASLGSACLAQTTSAPAPIPGSGVGSVDTPTPQSSSSASPAPFASPKRTPRPPEIVSSVNPKTPPTVADSRGPGWEKRADKDTAEGASKASDTQVIFDGDSITDFWQTTGLNVWNARIAKYHPIDFGISGDFTQSVLWRLDHGQAKGFHPKVIFLMIGTNDMRYTSTPQEIADGVAAIIKEYQQVCPDAVIVLQAIFPRAAKSDDPYRQKVNATNALLPKLADGSKVVYIDFTSKFLDADGNLTRDIMRDLLHPTEKGYTIWADAVTPLLDKYPPATAAVGSPQ